MLARLKKYHPRLVLAQRFMSDAMCHSANEMIAVFLVQRKPS